MEFYNGRPFYNPSCNTIRYRYAPNNDRNAPTPDFIKSVTPLRTRISASPIDAKSKRRSQSHPTCVCPKVTKASPALHAFRPRGRRMRSSSFPSLHSSPDVKSIVQRCIPALAPAQPNPFNGLAKSELPSSLPRLFSTGLVRLPASFSLLL